MNDKPDVTPLLDSDGRLAFDVACVGCGYNLRGVAAEAGKCPECGRRVADSYHADQLRFASEEAVRPLVDWVGDALAAVGSAAVMSPLAAGLTTWAWNGKMGIYVALVVWVMPVWPMFRRLNECDVLARDLPGLGSEEFEEATANARRWRKVTLGLLLGAGVVTVAVLFAPLSHAYAGRLAWIGWVVGAFALGFCAASQMEIFSAVAQSIPRRDIARSCWMSGRMLRATSMLLAGPALLALLWAEIFDCGAVAAMAMAGGVFVLLLPASLLVTAWSQWRLMRALTQMRGKPSE